MSRSPVRAAVLPFASVLPFPSVRLFPGLTAAQNVALVLPARAIPPAACSRVRPPQGLRRRAEASPQH